MVEPKAMMDAGYLEAKRSELVRLRDEMLRSVEVSEADENDVNVEASSQANEDEDDSQRLDMLEREGNLLGRDMQRLQQIERALTKIEEGTYGLSDVSGERIPHARLDAMPEAINTVAEQAASESRA
jgi:DnaK suppressor protein